MQSHEVSKRWWKKWHQQAYCRAATNGQFIKNAISAKSNELKHKHNEESW